MWAGLVLAVGGTAALLVAAWAGGRWLAHAADEEKHTP